MRGVGCDCLGLVRGVWRAVSGCDVGGDANYSRDWAEASGVESMLEGAAQHLLRVDAKSFAPGDVLVFRLRPHCVAKHAGIVASAATFIHAMEGAPACEVALSPWWRRRIAGVFRFPAE